jgi:hypothetical protein
MNVTTSGVALFLHIGVAIAGFMVAAILHASFHVLGRAKTVGEVRPLVSLMHRLEPLLPILALVLLVLGAWLVHLGHDSDGFRFSDGWITTGIVTIVVIEGLAGTQLAPRTKAIVERIKDASDGPIPTELRQQVLDPVMWDVAHVATGSFLGMVLVMADKPSGGIAWLFPVAGAVIGVGLSRWQLTLARAAGGGGAPTQRSSGADDTANTPVAAE